MSLASIEGTVTHAWSILELSSFVCDSRQSLLTRGGLLV